MGVCVGYARTSTVEQVAGLEDQVRELTEKGCERIFSEHISASDPVRPELEAMKAWVREGDTLIVTKPDRMARNVSQMFDLIDFLAHKGVNVVILSLGVDTSTSTGRLTLTVLSAVAQWEREIMLERQRAGIARAKAQGKYNGRPPSLTMEQIEYVRHARLVKDPPTPVVALMKELGVSRTTLHYVIKPRRAQVKGEEKA